MALAEQQTEWLLNNILVNGGWIIDNLPKKNVYFQKARPEHQHLLENFSNKKGYKKPDYILYKEDKIAGIIEAKRGGETLDKALKQATEYADMLEAPLVFASNGAYVETYHLNKQKPLFINGEKIDRLIKYKEAVKFIELGENEIYTISPELIKSKEDLIYVFKKVNNLLRKANIFAGYDRISEFSSILFLKLISEQEGEKSYWNSIKKQDDDFLISYLNGTVIKNLEKKYKGGVFSEINLKKPSIIRQIMGMIDPLILSDIKTDIKGDAFEYFLKNMNQADNDLGQYFTPRHIVKAMVHLVNPKFKETVYDPFCGTGGFLIESFNHIKENSIIKTEEDRKTLKENTLFGRDATKVSKIAKKNMILYGDGHSNIEETDSLEHPIYNKMSAIITNIPFSLKDVDYSDHYYNGLGKKNGDAICVLHCLEALEEGGRMAVIVPEGFLFKKALKDVRKFLLSRANLELIVSLPQGAFLPYTGVKTDILYFTNAHKPQAQEGYYYFDIKKDGFTLDAHRRKIDGANDIHKLEATNIRKSEKDFLKEQGFEFIDFEKIRDNDYNLVGHVYRKNSREAKFTLVKLQQIAVIENGDSAPQNSLLFEGGVYPFFRVSDVAKEHLSTNLINTRDKLNSKGIKGLKLFPKNSILFPKSGASTLLNHRAIMGRDGYVASHLAVIQPDESKVLYKYLYYILTSINAKSISLNEGYPSIRIKHLQDINIPLPVLEEQQKIIDLIQLKEKEIQMLKEKIGANKQSINKTIHQVWQPEEENGPVADKATFDTLIKAASKPLQS
jgi:type I restriction enzyme M protein